MHGIQIISRASLCCCMEGMRVFELDLLDNIRSTHISFHANLFHADGVVHTVKLIRLLLLLRKFKRKASNSHTSVCCSQVVKLKKCDTKKNVLMFSLPQVPNVFTLIVCCLLRLFTGRRTGRQAESRLLQIDSSVMLLFMA